MLLILILFVTLMAVELMFYQGLPKRTRTRIGGGVLQILLTIASTGFVISFLSLPLVAGLLVAGLSVYRGVNILRAMIARMHPAYLRTVTTRTLLWLGSAQLLVSICGTFWNLFGVPAYVLWVLLAAVELVLATIFFVTVRRHARRMNAPAELAHFSDRDLPSVTIAVAARNETDELKDCIISLLASNYPKLEILVLDDCSQSTRTSEVIRSFAHAGVRFIEGAEPDDNTWLAKNLAYNTLAEAASGEYLLFVGVDVRLEPNTLRQLVAYSLAKKKAMLCVMPHSGSGTRPSRVQTMRYAWELALPRRTFGGPPVLSSCWLISRKALHAAGGFRATTRMIVPEAYFAKEQLARDGYSFLASGSTYGVRSVKSTSRQFDTATRVIYPQLHRRPEMVALVSLVLFGLTVLPFGLIVATFFISSYWFAAVIAIIGYLVLRLTNFTILQLSHDSARHSQTLSLPFTLLAYIGLTHYSMYRYEFTEVLWRGRNVCMPVMHTTPRLPKTD